MQRLPLVGGSYVARSVIANAQRCINLFPEQNPKDAPCPVTHYQRPGYRPLVQAADHSVVRCLYQASNGNGYCVIGQGVYSISPGWALTQIGALSAVKTTPAKMVDNGQQIIVVDNSPLGYTVNLSDNTFAQINDPTGIFQGATTVDYIDTFIIWNLPKTNFFGSSNSNSITFNPTFIAGKTNWPDALQAIVVSRREIYLIGALKSTIFFDAGGALFPFAELPGASFDHGTIAPYSVAQADISVYFLSKDLQGQGMVMKGKGYDCKRISNHALEFALQGYPDISDAIGFCYQQGGHLFYQLELPSANATWVYDEASTEWHQRAWTDANGGLNKTRANCYASLYGLNVVGDQANGTLYALDQNIYYDEVDGVRQPISCIRGFPHIMTGIKQVNGQEVPVLADGKQMEFQSFMADIGVGDAPSDVPGKAAQVGLRWSDDRGRTWGNAVLQSNGLPGQYITRPTWQGGLGQARDRVFELSYSFAGPAALNGAWVNARVLEQ